MALTSPRFAGNARLQQAAQNSPAMKRKEVGPAVRIVQQALIDSGFKMPVSTRRHRAPDGIYGYETSRGIRRFQRKHRLKVDGITGKNTLHRMDALLTGLPSTPIKKPDGLPVNVAGVVKPIRQRNSMSCWAASYTMMLSWKRQESLDVPSAVQTLGPKWVSIYTANTGLPARRTVEFASDSGLTALPLINPSMERWIDMLRLCGLLWVMYGWRFVNGAGQTVRGRHAIIVHGLYGGGSPANTHVKLIDPADGKYHERSYQRFISDFETGYTVGTGLQDGLSQVLYF